MHHLAPVPTRPTLVACPPLPERAASTDLAETHPAGTEDSAATERAASPGPRAAQPTAAATPGRAASPASRATHPAAGATPDRALSRAAHPAAAATPGRALSPASRAAHPAGRGRPALTLIPGGRAPSTADPDAVQVGDSGPSTLCANLARCVVEILAGARSLDQIARWVTDAVYAHLLRRSLIAQRTRVDATDAAPRPRVHIGEPKLSSPAKDVVEAVVMVHQPGRSRAVAIRLERHRSRWRASAINVL